jgi:hypothetical protein
LPDLAAARRVRNDCIRPAMDNHLAVEWSATP